jgi:hypothetical protein
MRNNRGIPRMATSHKLARIDTNGGNKKYRITNTNVIASPAINFCDEFVKSADLMFIIILVFSNFFFF